ncbi:putative rho gtpase activator protein [Botrytis cinerea BcDW1]|uniref:Putative rho gtpase activator protein n=1 Tax=Botryotinia fuckeliana (strain BcDW1) TaxID=1290391 RepID=M7TDX8_BOTF1|nr:putative rho gtpase activator protein [Botrytis cinerea BcDW1]
MSFGGDIGLDTTSSSNAVGNGGNQGETTGRPATPQDATAKAVQDVTSSEIGISTLLTRLKQSIASAKEFALFLKKRSIMEEEHSNGLKKLCKATGDNIRRPEHRHGSFLQSYEEVLIIHERMAENGAQFGVSLHQMHEDLIEMASNIEKGRKHWKNTGLAAEQRAADTEAAMKKSKAKYDSLADEYDRARTGDRQPGKIFGLKGPKSAAQHEEDLLRKVQAADADYASKVQAAQSQRTELWSKSRPEAVKALEDLIQECDSALTLQMQKFASFNEKLLLSNGLNISPIKGKEQGTLNRSLREVVHAIDNVKDLSNYISSFSGNMQSRITEIKYERNPVLQPAQNTAQRQSDPNALQARQGPVIPPQPSHQVHMSQPFNQSSPPTHQRERSFSHGPSLSQHIVAPVVSPTNPISTSPDFNTWSPRADGPPQISTLPFQPQPQNETPIQQTPQNPTTHAPVSHGPSSAPLFGAGSAPAPGNSTHLAPLKPVFGLSLEELFDRDGSAVPMIVYQCIQAVDLFGLEVEGIYRLSGTASHIMKIKAMFDNDASKVDFRNPESFFHDVNSVAGLLKQFFRELPDPLLTIEQYPAFIEAAKHDDEIVRRDSLHAIINGLPDPNYATLRALTLHLNRVQESSASNRMTASNLAIVFGPTLMGANSGPNMSDAGWQVRVVDTILKNTYQIFDDD